jgi:hypothetical protein
MPFLEDARDFLRQELAESRFVDGYVHRVLAREGADLHEAVVRRRLRLAVGDDDLVGDTELGRRPHMLLVGNAGSGKSFVTAFTYSRAADALLVDPSAPFPILLDLGHNLPSDLDLARGLNHRSRGLFSRALTEHAPGCALFLDELDLVLRVSHLFINDLRIFLQAHWDRLAQVLVTCRRAAWEPEWFSSGTTPLAAYHADQLDEDAYAQILVDEATRREFFGQCQTLGISVLLDTPFDGFYLAREFRDGRPLPASRRDCLHQRITEALRGRGADREGLGPPAHRLRSLARHLACLASFSPWTAWTPEQATDVLGGSSVLAAGDPVRAGEVEALLRRPLFRRVGQGFSFVHDLYREFLTAEALAALPLRKQRQLLEAGRPGRPRVRTPHRGVAAFLAEVSEPFRRHLLACDPLVAFFAETPAVGADEREALLRAVLDEAVAQRRAPWWEVAPRGEPAGAPLARHRPADAAGFLRPYLEGPDVFARLWGTTCAETWGGVVELNGTLCRLALDDSQHAEIRHAAVAAVAATDDLAAVRTLYGLFDDADDSLRGRLLRAYRRLERPAPADVIARLRGGSRDRSLLCALQSEAGNFAQDYGPEELVAAFGAADEHFEALQDLRGPVIDGLFGRAVALHCADVPARLVLRCWLARDARMRLYLDNVNRLLLEHRSLFRAVWRCALELLAREGNQRHECELSDWLLDVCGDDVFDLVPTPAEAINRAQQRLITSVLTRYFGRNPTPERLALFRSRAPTFTGQLQLAPPTPPAPAPDVLDERRRLTIALGEPDGGAALDGLLGAIAASRCGQDCGGPVQVAGVVQVLDRVGPALRRRALAAFRAGVDQIHYGRIKTGPREFRMTPTHYEIPFWVLRHYGEELPPPKVAEVITCYGLSGCARPEDYEAVLDELRERDRPTWEGCLVRLLEEDTHEPHYAVRHLLKHREPVYLARCRERLELGQFSPTNLPDLLDYLMEMAAGDYAETLRRCYAVLRSCSCRDGDGRLVVGPQPTTEPARESHRSAAAGATPPGDRPDDLLLLLCQFRALLPLMACDDAWAWTEFAERLRRGEVAVADESLVTSCFLRLLPRPPVLAPAHLAALADWYASVERERAGQGRAGARPLASHLLETLVAVGGDDAIRQLRRLETAGALPDARWLSHAILRVEERELAAGAASWESAQLLDFINRDSQGAVRHERDLFECVCQAVEEVQEALERRAEGVAGFWDPDGPKPEPECQNVLWPLLRAALRRLGVVAVEERFIGTNKCDFWVEYPRPGAEPFRVAVELKVARKRYGHTALVDPVETQLWHDYLRPSGSRHGVFVVLWFRDGVRYGWPKQWANKDALAATVAARCKVVAIDHQVELTSYVIDLTTPFRRH